MGCTSLLMRVLSTRFSIEPSNKFSLGPFTQSSLAVCPSHNAFAVLLVVYKFSFIIVSVWPSQNTFTILPVFYVVSNILISVCPGTNTFSVLFVVYEVSTIFISVCPGTNTPTVLFVVFKLTFIVGFGKDSASCDDLAAAPIAFKYVLVFLNFNSSTISFAILIPVARVAYAGWDELARLVDSLFVFVGDGGIVLEGAKCGSDLYQFWPCFLRAEFMFVIFDWLLLFWFIFG